MRNAFLKVADSEVRIVINILIRVITDVIHQVAANIGTIIGYRLDIQ